MTEDEHDVQILVADDGNGFAASDAAPGSG